MINVIISKDNNKIKYAVSLRDNKNRNLYKEFIGESKKCLELALKANLVKEVFTYDILDIDESIPQYLVNEQVMKKLSITSNPEGVVFIAKMPVFKKDKYNKILYLDEINDPGNLGTMIRTAFAFNFDAVVTSPKSVSIYNEKVLAACKGSNYLIPTFSSNIAELLDGHKVIVTDANKSSVDVSTLEKMDKFILVMGNEAHGVSNEIRKLADVTVKIPITNIDSLNVSVAAGILMYSLTK